jgi:branched-chain amino acid transport system permease protein
MVVSIVFFASLGGGGTDDLINIFTLAFLYMALGQMWNLLAGYSGLVSLGQQIFVGLGGYSVAIMTQKYSFGLPVGILTAAGVSLVFAFVISFPIFKMKGVYFTIGTWIAAEAVLIYFTNWAFVNYAIGYNITIAYSFSTRIIYIMAYILGIGSVALVYGLLRSKSGLALMSMRDNEAAAEVRGININRTKLKLWLIAAVFSGVTGAVLYLTLVFIKPSAAFGIDWTVLMVFIVVIGGIGTIEGPIIGAFIYAFVRQYLYNYPGYSMVILGTIAVAMIMIMPKGIAGTLHDKYGFELFSVRRYLFGRVGEKRSLKEVLSKK